MDIAIIVMILATIFCYIPYSSLLLKSEKELNSYGATSLLMALGAMVQGLGVLLSFRVSWLYKIGKKDYLSVICFVVYLCSMMMLPRRTFLGFVVSFAIVFYSINRTSINRKMIGLMFILLFVIYSVFFPFYNVVRWKGVVFEPLHPIESITELVSVGIENYGAEKQAAKEISDTRSEGVYMAVYNMIGHMQQPGLVRYTMMEVDEAIPKVLNPNKGKGTEGIFENMTGAHLDIADSFFMLSAAEFGLMGGIYTLLLYLIVFLIYTKYERFVRVNFHCLTISLLLLTQAISTVWNIETKFSAAISWLFSSIFFVVTLMLLEKCKVICIRNRF
jgi:hypothetical protein